MAQNAGFVPAGGPTRVDTASVAGLMVRSLWLPLSPAMTMPCAVIATARGSAKFALLPTPSAAKTVLPPTVVTTRPGNVMRRMRPDESVVAMRSELAETAMP